MVVVVVVVVVVVAVVVFVAAATVVVHSCDLARLSATSMAHVLNHIVAVGLSFSPGLSFYSPVDVMAFFSLFWGVADGDILETWFKNEA